MDRRSFLHASALGGLALLGSGLAGGAAAAPRAVVTRRSIPQPIAALVTRWDSDPWSRGSYSALPPGTSPSVRHVLANARMGERIVLAGEYASPDYPATTTGAYLSGRHAAERLLRSVEPRRVVVVGAGMAGAAATARLLEAGVAVTVLEARRRVGGRVSSDSAWGAPVELGAAWVHGVRANPVTTLARQAGLGLVPTNYGDLQVRDTMTGRPSPTAEARDTALYEATERIDSAWPPRDMSVGTWLRRRGFAGGRVDDWAAAVEVTQEYGLDPGDLGVRAYSEGRDYRGGDAMVSGGYARIVSALLAGVEVRLSVAVSSVVVDGHRVTITDAHGRQQRADAVVVAVPLALLRAGSPRIAPLPHAVQNALLGLRTGNLEKVVLRYAEQWWGKEQVYGVVGGGAPGAPAGTLAALRWTEWYSLVPVVGFPALVGFAGGRAARTRPTSDAACVAEATAALAAAFAR